MPPPLPKLLILGSGFGGYSLARNVSRGVFDVTIVSPRNYFVFSPLLPSAVVGSVEFRSILEPVRRRVRSAHMVEAAAERVDWDARVVHCRSAVSDEDLAVPFDLLVIAVGAALADYGVPGVAEHALRLQDIGDRRALRPRAPVQPAGRGAPRRARGGAGGPGRGGPPPWLGGGGRRPRRRDRRRGARPARRGAARG